MLASCLAIMGPGIWGKRALCELYAWDPVYVIRVTDSYCWDIQCKEMLMPSPPAICLFSVLIDPPIV